MTPEGADYNQWQRLTQELDEILKSRKVKRVVEKLLEELPHVEPDRSDSPTDQYFTERLTAASKRESQLKQEIDTRVELHDYFLDRLDYQITEAAFSLSELSPWAIGYNRGVDTTRNFLERQLAQLRRERRDTELKAWEDIVGLRGTLREARGEYRELLRRYQLLRRGERHGG